MALTKLQAINEILTSVGETAMLTLVAGATDATNAEVILDAEARKLLARGWAFNTDERFTLANNSDGRVPVPADVLQIDATDPDLDYVQRGGFLWDRARNTDLLWAPAECRVVRDLPFESCPYHIQRQIVARAAQKYQRSYVGSPQLDGFATEETLMATADGADAEADSDDYNVLDNPELAYLRRNSYLGGR